MTGPKNGKVKVAAAKRTKVIVEQAPKKKKAKKSKTSGTLKNWGGAIGGYFGGTPGAMIGQAAGSLISKITGFGDYKVNKNSLIQGNTVPSFSTSGDGMVLSHSEMIGDVQGSVGFALTSFQLNPGLLQTFPLLSRIAESFEEYEMDGLVFMYRPSSGSAVSSTSSALGVVILATDYDAINPPFQNKQQMESYEYATSTVPFTGCIHPVECARAKNVLDNLYVRAGPQPPGSDIRLYDMGNFQIATQGMQSVYTVGELWVSYNCRFRKPRLSGNIYNSQHLRSITLPSGTANDQLLFGTDPPYHHETLDSDQEFYAIAVANRAFGIKIKQVGVYILYVRTNFTTSTVGPAYVLTAGSNITLAQPYIFEGNQSGFVNSNTNFRTMSMTAVTVTSAGITSNNDVAYTMNAAIGTAGDTDFQIWRIGTTAPLLLSELPAQFTSLSLTDGAKVLSGAKSPDPFDRPIMAEMKEQTDRGWFSIGR